MTAKRMVAFRLDPDDIGLLRAMAARRDITVTDVVRRLIRRGAAADAANTE